MSLIIPSCLRRCRVDRSLNALEEENISLGLAVASSRKKLSRSSAERTFGFRRRPKSRDKCSHSSTYGVWIGGFIQEVLVIFHTESEATPVANHWARC